MSTFDKTLPSGVGLIDFSVYADPDDVLAYNGWPARLVEQPLIKAAIEIEAQLESGWLPGDTELRNAPKLSEWSIANRRSRGQGIYLLGYTSGHPRFGGDRTFVETSHLGAIDTANFGWARTLSRWYRLGKRG